MSLAAIPSLLNDHLPAAGVATTLMVATVLFRLIAKTAIRLMVLAVLAAVAAFVYFNQTPLRTCARTCACGVVDQEITVPACSADEGS